jgi:hypothetical protein
MKIDYLPSDFGTSKMCSPGDCSDRNHWEAEGNEGNDLAFDIKAVASPNAGSDLTVVVQT